MRKGNVDFNLVKADKCIKAGKGISKCQERKERLSVKERQEKKKYSAKERQENKIGLSKSVKKKRGPSMSVKRIKN